MKFSRIKKEDFDKVKTLQPEGWSDIIAEFEFHLNSGYSNPIKVTIDEDIIGVGVSAQFRKTAWLDEIIVHNNHRNKGIGLEIVKQLLSDLELNSVESVLLIATPLGESVYKKLGFRKISEYVQLKKVRPVNSIEKSDKIIPYENRFYSELINLDKEISGETREPIIKEHLTNCWIYYDKEIKGYYLPTLSEGPIMAVSALAGTELMNKKLSGMDSVILPNENKNCINYLLENGFDKPNVIGKRMIRGKDIDWKPDCIYSRVGGNFG